ncbi:DNA polymerase I [Pirellulimonas nuda]|uniref:DNA polymerase I n=1 Tax=Pirellulimonas nuda TaxID=2528009 RepID=A0A518DHK4_9BACT|nr:DNA polymerase [Pirellulimonas nuda]QDU90960.1 DNA polymerase I [Pirellulimonas nuda]
MLEVSLSPQHDPVSFSPWKPSLGKALGDVIALDTETTLIDDVRHWEAPELVLAAATDGQRGYFLTPKTLGSFLRDHRGCQFVMHNAAFDLAVIHKVAPQLDIYRLVERGQVWDTMLQHKLLKLGREGHAANGKGLSTLATCCQEYLGLTLDKDAADASGDAVRLNFGQYLHRPAGEIPRQYLEYLARDTLATLAVHQELRRRTDTLLNSAADQWGYVDAQWLADAQQRYGPLTHHLQLKASIVLREITANGLHIDAVGRRNLKDALGSRQAELRERLRKQGYLAGEPKCNKALQGILRDIQRRHPELSLERTEKKQEFRASKDALEQLRGIEPFVDDLLGFKQCEKLLGSFVDKLFREDVHPSFQPLLTTGRTSSFGELNAQNLPRDPRVRSCFTPHPGNVFIDADYSTIELGTLALAVEAQFGETSEMKRLINAGVDLHRTMAATFYGKPAEQVSGEERGKAKAINFGVPGGMGARGLRGYAAASFGASLTEEEADAMREDWFEQFPEMKTFLAREDHAIRCMAEKLGLSWGAYNEALGRQPRRPIDGSDPYRPEPTVSRMLLKAIKVPEPAKGNGEPYSEQACDYLWSRLQSGIDHLPAKFHQDVRLRRPSPQLQKAVMHAFDRLGVFTLTGRLRANSNFTARHNTIFQGLAADGAKQALWRLWRAGYRIANFIHDEIIVEVPEDSNLAWHEAIVRTQMIDAMSEVVPGVRIGVESAVSTCWHKEAKPILDAQGRRVAWSPPTEEAA